MSKTISLIGILLFSVILFISCSENREDAIMEEDAPNVDVKILQGWQGDFPVNQLNILPTGQHEQGVGYITDAETFAGIWLQFKPGKDIPSIDFNTKLVLFARNIQYYNRISIGRVTLTNGVAEVLAMETMSAMPIGEKVALSLAEVARQGITAINIGDKEIMID